MDFLSSYWIVWVALMAVAFIKGIWPVFTTIIPIKMCVYYKIWLHPLLGYLAASKIQQAGMPRKLVNFPHNSKCMSLRILYRHAFPFGTPNHHYIDDVDQLYRLFAKPDARVHMIK